eukprot:825428_1
MEICAEEDQAVFKETKEKLISLLPDPETSASSSKKWTSSVNRPRHVHLRLLSVLHRPATVGTRQKAREALGAPPEDRRTSAGGADTPWESGGGPTDTGGAFRGAGLLVAPGG